MNSNILSDLAELPEMYFPSVSPTDDKLAYYSDGTGRNELHVYDILSNHSEQWSDGEVPRDVRYPFRWSQDGEYVYFHHDSAGDERNDVFVIDRHGSVECVVALQGRTILQDVGPDDRYLLVANSGAGQLNLYSYDRQYDDCTRITDYDSPVTDATFDPAGEYIAYTTNEIDDRNNTDVYVADADGSNPRRLPVGDVGYETAFQAWHPSGNTLLIADSTTNTDRCGVFDLDTDSIEWYNSEEYEEHPVAFTPDGSRVLALRLRNAARVPIIFDSAGGQEFALPDGVASFPDDEDAVFFEDGTAAVMFSSSSKRKSLLRYDLANHKYQTLKDATYGPFAEDAFSSTEHISYEAPDGLEIGGLLYDSGVRPSPAVVLLHGGPSSQALQYFNRYVQFLVETGYTVLQPNYRGSTGRGRAFRNRIRGDWGGGDAMDVAEAGRWLASKPWIDADRVAVAGGSYGGYGVLAQIVNNPGIWWAGVAWNAITDLHRLHENIMPQFRDYLERQMGDPESNYDLWRERSPIENVDCIRCPVLIMHGTNDSRCPISQGRLFRDALEDRGWEESEDFVYRELTGGHSFTNTDRRTRVFQLLDEFLNEWMSAQE